MRLATALVRHELRLFVSLLLWVARRTHQTRDGQAFGYARGEGALMFGFGFVCVIESVTMSVLLRDLPDVHRVVLVLDVYTVVLVVGMHAANVVRPHVLDDDSLRIRRAAHVDLRIPLQHIASVRRELRTTHHRADGELDLAMGARTTVTLELHRPVVHFTLLGRQKPVRLVRLHADEPGELVRALTDGLTAGLTGTLTRARNEPSPKHADPLAAAAPATVPPAAGHRGPRPGR